MISEISLESTNNNSKKMKKGIVRTFGKEFTLSIVNGKGSLFKDAKSLVDFINTEDVVVTNPMALTPLYRRRLKHNHKTATINFVDDIYAVYGADGSVLFSDTPEKIIERCNAEAIEIVNKNDIENIFRDGLLL